MRLTTLCYIEKNGKYLMLHRTKKQNDQSHDKWLGIGGKFEQGEHPDDCLLREVKEETGLRLTKYSLRGLVKFISDEYETEYMHLYTATEYDGELIDSDDCDEGELVWIDKNNLNELNLWEGDKLFFKMLEETTQFFNMRLVYKGDRLVESQTDVDESGTLKYDDIGYM